MHMEKRGEAAFLTYCAVLVILAISHMISKANILTLGYLVVVLVCAFRFFLIMKKQR